MTTPCVGDILYLIAGNAREAEYWIKTYGTVGKPYHIANTLQGLKCAPPQLQYLLAGSWSERPDIHEISRLLKIKFAVEMGVDEHGDLYTISRY